MLASFSKPVIAYEIRPYLSLVLKDFGVDEKTGNDAVHALINYYMEQVIQGVSIRHYLGLLYKLYVEKEFRDNESTFDLSAFYLLYHAWDQLE